MKPDLLGDRCKAYEQRDNARLALPGIPLLARLDGKAFHTFTRGLDRPFDARLQRCMVECTSYLVQEMHANIGYTQSDEIQLLWEVPEDGEFPFNGKFQKLTSVLAGMASGRFTKLVALHLPMKAHLQPVFDCRVWQVPSRQSAFDAFLWRQDDATKNSISMAAHALYSTKELHVKNSKDKQELLHQKGINWNDYPDVSKRGQFVRRATVMRPLSAEERARIPEQHRPAADRLLTRTCMVEVVVPPLRRMQNPLGFLFDGEVPISRAIANAPATPEDQDAAAE